MASGRHDGGLVRRVERVRDAHDDSVPLRLALVEEIRAVVPFDWYVFLLTDPETTVGSAPLADIPVALLPLLPKLIAGKYLTRGNRWTSIKPPGVALASRADEDLSRTPWWLLIAQHGVRDVTSLVFEDRFGCWGLLDLWRVGSTGRFGNAEAELLVGVVEPVTLALRRSQARTFRIETPRPQLRGPVVLLFSEELDLLGQTPETADYLRLLIPPDQDRSPVPAGAYNVAAQLLAVEAGVDTHPASARVHLTDGRWLTMRAARMDATHIASVAGIAVSIEDASPMERLDVFTRSFALTAREGQLLRHLAGGIDSATIARAMFVSEHTVQDHLKSIFAKTETHNRKSLLALALGT